MRILVLNSGSSTLKFDLVSVDLAGGAGDTGALAPTPARRLAHGLVDRIGNENATVQFSVVSPAVARVRTHTRQHEEEPDERRTALVRDHRDAVTGVFEWLGTVSSGEGDEPGGGTLQSGIEAVGHRVVSGGDRFTAPVLIDDNVLAALDGISDLVPLHNPPAILCIRAAREVLGSSIPMVAVFDTAFHATLPDYAYTYALPRELAERHRIRRYGFHGTAHQYMLKRYSEKTGVPISQAGIITLQLGNGCSATAIRNGRSVDTSMGFTPLEGLVMGTRSGDIDPGIVGYLVEKEGLDAAEIGALLNRESGLLGISGRSGDMRDLLAAEERDAQARLAVEVFCYRVRKYIGAYLAALGGAQAVVFGGGIGEHASTIRARICEGMEWCGLRLDPERNAATTGTEGRISADGSPIAAYVVKVDESALIARYTAEYVSQHVRRGAEP